MASANKRVRIVDDQGEFSDISLDEEEFQERLLSLFEFVSKLKVSKYANTRLDETAKKYETEIQERENAKNKIRPSQRLDPNDPTRKEKLWSHLVPSEILRYIFKEFCISNADQQDDTVLCLVKVCKNWRELILKYSESDEKFAEMLWYPVLHKFSHNIDWKHLVLIPDQYLKLMYNVHPREMTKAENKTYRSLLHENYNPDNDDEWMMNDSNIPLLIAIFRKCPRLYHLDLMGELCMDLFFEIGDKLKELRSIAFSFTSHCDPGWFEHCIYPESNLVKSLHSIHIERSYWFDDEACFYLSHCEHLASFYGEKPQISSDGIYELFKGCTKLQGIDLFKPEILYNYDGDQDLSEAFKELSERNKVIRYISFDCCGAFNDKCLGYLMKKGVCSELQTLTISYSTCTQRTIDTFKTKRPEIDTDITIMDF